MTVRKLTPDEIAVLDIYAEDTGLSTPDLNLLKKESVTSKRRQGLKREFVTWFNAQDIDVLYVRVQLSLI